MAAPGGRRHEVALLHVLEEHRRRYGAAEVHCVLLEVCGGKSEAVELEERAIRRLQRLGLARVLNVAGRVRR